MKKLWKHIVISTALLACGAMPAVAQGLVGPNMDRSGRASRGRAVRQRSKASRIDVTADDRGVVFVADMEGQESGRRKGRRPVGLAHRVAWQDEMASDQSVAGIPVFEQQEGSCDSCGSSGCDGSACGGDACGSCNRWAHGTGVFGEFLYLRARDSEVTYASPVDGATVPIPGPGNQMAPVGIVDPDYSSGARIGFNWAWDEMTSIRGTYTRFESDTTNGITAEPGNFVLAGVTHPGVNNAANNWLEGAASLDIDFQLADVEYRWLFSYGDLHAVNLFAGVRYGELVQDFRADFSVNGTRTVDTRVRFEGGGLRLGFDAERYAACTGWLVYGRGAASFVAGEFRGSYYQNSSFANPEIDTAWKAGRVVTILDLELGLGWKSRSGRLRLGAGYLFSAWLNTVQTDTFIDAVQANRFAGLGGETTTFDGFTAHAEYRF